MREQLTSWWVSYLHAEQLQHQLLLLRELISLDPSLCGKGTQEDLSGFKATSACLSAWQQKVYTSSWWWISHRKHSWQPWGGSLPGRSLKALPQTLDTVTKITSLRRWNLCKRLAQDLWEKRSQDYLQLLQKFQRWKYPKLSVQVGDVVLLKDSELFLRSWPLAVVEQVYTPWTRWTGESGYPQDLQGTLQAFRHSAGSATGSRADDSFPGPGGCSGLKTFHKVNLHILINIMSFPPLIFAVSAISCLSWFFPVQSSC